MPCPTIFFRSCPRRRASRESRKTLDSHFRGNDDVNPMRLFIFTYSLVFLGVVGLCPPILAGENGEAILSATETPSLSLLVRTYVQGSPGQSQDELLSHILNHPQATLESVAMAIRQAPRYGKEPVGAQPRRSHVVRGRIAEYALYVPPSYTPDLSYPLILCLHGAGFTGSAYLDRWVPRLEDRYILACPTIARGGWWTRYGEELVLATIRKVQSQYHVDPDRVFLTGMSNGGIGTWIIGMHYADLFAGIAPMASGIDDVLYPFLENLAHTPVYVIHGAEDRIMPVRLSRELVKEMHRRGIVYQYREHSWTHPHAGGHFFPRQELPALITWFDEHQRLPLPHRVSLVRDATHLTPFSWIRIDSTEQIAAFSENLVDGHDEYITGGVYAKMQAELVGPNRIAVSTLRVRRYTLLLNQDLVDFSKPVVVETNGTLSFKGILEAHIATLLQEARHRSDTQTLFSAKLTVDVPEFIPTN